MSTQRPESDPRPLRSLGGPAAEALRLLEEASHAKVDETRAWDLGCQRRRVRARQKQLVAALACAAGVLLLILGTRWHHDRGSSNGPSVQESLAGVPLGVGRARLADGSWVEVAQATEAIAASPTPMQTQVRLTHGVVLLEVAHQRQGHRLEVVHDTLHFVAVGTRFRVSALADEVRLDVQEGTVAVLEGARELRRIDAGGSWRTAQTSSAHPTKTHDEPPAAAPAPMQSEVSPSSSIVPPRPSGPLPPEASAVLPAAPTASTHLTALAQGGEADDHGCSVLARAGHTESAIGCYEHLAAGRGVRAELACYESARLQRDVLANLAGALERLRGCERSFPQGSLRGEVQVSIVELLDKLGRTAEALAESERLLSTRWGVERHVELRLLRGNLYRRALGDCLHAIEEYAAIAAERGAQGDEAQFQQAQCLERTSHPAAALGVYKTYLQRDQPKHATEARARTEALAP